MFIFLDLFGEVDPDSGWWSSMKYYPVAVDEGKLLPEGSWDSRRLADGDVSSISKEDVMSSIVFDKIEGRHFQLCSPSSLVAQPDLEVDIDGVKYWLPSGDSYSKTYIDDHPYYCFSSLSKVEYGQHSLSIEQKSGGSIQIEAILAERPLANWSTELAAGSFFYILATFVAWCSLILLTIGICSGLYVLFRLPLEMMGFAEQSITKPRKAWTPVPLERMDRDVEQEGVLHDSLARSTEGSIHLAGDTEARPDKRSAQEEDEESLLPRYGQ